MPGIAGTSPASLEHLGRPLFRAHKALPRRPNGDPSVHVIHASPSDPIVDTSNGGAHATAPTLPLTPPGVPPDESPTPTEREIQKLASLHSMSGTVTPSKPSHPPTPETTPPQLPATTLRPGFGGQFRQASSSSRAESFQTACEMISDGETETPHRSSPSSRQSTRQRSLHKTVQSEPKNARPEDTTSVVDHSDSLLLKPSRYEGINGEWATENTDRFAASRQRRRRSRNHSSDTPTANVPEQPQNTYSTSARDLEVPRTRERNVRVRVRDAQDTGASPYPEQYSEKIDWNTPEGRTDSCNNDDSRRFSGVSTSSTIEVMIVDTPEPYKPSLRHTEKRVSLRSTSSPITRSERGSLVSNPDSQHRLIHKAARISENDRRSIASEISISESSTQGGLRQQVEVVPVVVIPERHSSLKSSASTSRRPSNASSQPSSRRTRTRSGSRPESLDRPPQKRRTVSNSSAPAHQDTDSRGRSIGRPIIPPRSSSLSAPTSQNNSRATSLTSVSSRNYPSAVETEKQSQQPEPPTPEPMKAPQVCDRADVLKTQSILIGVEDMANLRSPSGAFTLGSIPSSSPGLVEISEATLVPFFPHNNESLLLVDPQHRPGPQGLAIRVEFQGSPAKPEFPQSPGQGEVDSPLQNPRQPPNPPVCKISPPTPVSEADREPERGTGNGETGEQPPRRFGSVRRPWKLRPRSDSFNSIARSFSVTSAKNRMAGKDIDGKLHPFWRPRRFWEDTSESEDQSPREQAFRSPALEADQVISNSLGMPQQRVVFQGPPISPRSIDSKRSSDEAASRRQARDSLVGSRVFMPEALYSQTSLHQRRYRSLSWWRLRLRFGSVRSFRKRLRRSWQQRAEGKREARREALKQSIGEAVLVDSSTQTRSMVR